MENNLNKSAFVPHGQKIYGNPEYGPKEDIYNRAQKVTSNSEDFQVNEEKESYEPLGQDLDVPGSNLDDADEKTGEEDEENNYYSLAGDDYDNLDLYDPEKD